MTEELIIKLGQDAIRTTAMIAAPMLLGALIIGLIISVLQAVTQINEATLTFIPKMVVIFMVIIIAGPWMLDTMSHYTIELFDNISTFVRN
jgi:flagellar biosynthesis protein FliQ